MFVNYLAALIFGYALGSIPFGLLFTRLAGHGDIREIGSGNIGATNVLRTGNKWLAAATLLADMSKGALAIFIVGYFLKEVPLALIFAGAGAFLGHIFPVWLKFKGGKGVAVYIGIMLALNPMTGAMMILTWLFFAYALRISSLAALSMAAATPFFIFIFGDIPLILLALFISALIFHKHWANIKRLMDGSEPKIGEK
ncbi:MAG: glycerol-3-phosphate 1-O-acyltransferase PlsY [Devosiaceae bacterium]|nr:glycerol-3-phosphate 1-O-acyltransferase PlsY [Devosiaceae bacterium]